MYKVIEVLQVPILLGLAILLSLAVMFLFFGGTWEGVRFGLEIFGAVYIFQIAYRVVKGELLKRKNAVRDKPVIDKYFK